MRAMFELVEDRDEALRAASWPAPHPAHDLDLGEQEPPVLDGEGNDHGN